jgi:large subunit ribosomal protein L7/L12
MSLLWSCPARSSLLRSIASLSSWDEVRRGARWLGSAAAREAEDEAEARSAPSERVERLAEDISALSLLEVSDLTTLLRRKLGLPEGMGMMPMGMMPGMQMGGGANAAAPVEAKVEKTSFDVKLEKFDAGSKIKIIKEVRTFTALGLKEAKELVEKAPVVLKAGVGKEEAEQIIEKLKSVGATALME